MKGDAAEPEAEVVDRLFADLIHAGENRPLVRGIAAGIADEPILIALLRRAVPFTFLEEIAAARPWSERPRVLARVALSPRAPRTLALRLVGSLLWRDLAELASTMRLAAAVRNRAETLLCDGLREMRLGDRIALARLATPAVLAPLLIDGDRKVVDAALACARLREEDLVTALGRDSVPLALVEAAAESTRWCHSYAVGLALVLHPRTPLPIALQRITALVPRDLRRVAEDRALHPLVRSACRTVLAAGD